VREVLREIGADQIPELLVVNKLDVADPGRLRELSNGEATLAVSGRTGEGLEKLRDAVAERLRSLATVIELVVPYDRGDVLAALHRDGEVLIEVHADAGTRVRARIEPRELGRYREFVTA
jgi:GTP-binding protein HflX